MTEALEPVRRRSRRRLLGVVALVMVGVLGLLTLHYLPFFDRAHGLERAADTLQQQLEGLGPGDIDAARAADLRLRIASLDTEVEPFRGLLSSDPLMALARTLPFVGAQVRDADALIAGVGDALDAAGSATTVLDRFVAVRTAHDAATGAGTGPGGDASIMASMVGLMADSTADVDRMQASLAAADAALAGVGEDAVPQMRTIRDRIRGQIAKYGPLLADYARLDDVLPGMLGQGGSKRYLVLAQDPAELRPTGGYIGTVGIVEFQGGDMTSHDFQDVFDLDLLPGLAYVAPPQALRDHLLGDVPWLLADANWSPDFPTSAQQALRAYETESGDTDVDGVIALTTFALDRILEVTGPVDLPEHGVTVRAGDVTLTILGETRTVDPNGERKGIIDDLAAVLLERLLDLPADRWADLGEALVDAGSDRLIQVWTKDPAATGFLAGTSWAGQVRQDPGDYLYVVQANMAPTSKYDLVVSRRTDLDVQLAEDGAAAHHLALTWQNDAALPGEPYAAIRSYSTSPEGLYGAYVRALVPVGSTLEVAAGHQGRFPVTGAEEVSTESGRQVFGNYLLMPPGASDLAYDWTTPGVATLADGTRTYRLTVQRQPGAQPDDLTVRVTLPAGATLLDTSPSGIAEGDVVTFASTGLRDQDIVVHYQP